MNSFLEAALKDEPELIANRRALHTMAEVGFELHNTMAYVEKKLKEYGYTPQKVGRSGLMCTVGSGSKTILLRADADALPMQEESGLPFAATNGNCHSCAHDCHTAMLLCAAKLLKKQEAELKGQVKLMFQPAEELLSGAKDMIAHGLLENPTVDAAFALHIMTGVENSQVGTLMYSAGIVTKSGDSLRITVKGIDAHGSTPEKGVDAIHIAAHIVLALEALIARESPSNEEIVLVVGKIFGGTTANSVAGGAVLEASLRTCNEPRRAQLLRRITEVSQGIAATFRGEAEVEVLFSAPSLVNHATLTEDFARYGKELLPAQRVQEMGKMDGGEDFTYVAQKVPASFFILGAGSVSEGYKWSMHHPAMLVDESALKVGAAAYSHFASRWLEEQE